MVASAVILTIVGAVALVPDLRVHGAVHSNDGIVLAQDVRVEEVAGRVVTVAVNELLLVVGRSGLADSSALGRVIDGKHAHAKVRVLSLGVERRLDGAAELSRTSEVGLSRWRSGFDVAIGTGNDDLELIPPLADIGSHIVADGRAEERALVVGSA